MNNNRNIMKKLEKEVMKYLRADMFEKLQR